MFKDVRYLDVMGKKRFSETGKLDHCNLTVAINAST